MLTVKRLREVLDYDPSTGVFRWTDRAPIRSRGKFAGTVNGKGYVMIGLDHTRHQAHRLAWFHYYGEWPAGDLDHRDRVSTNNAIDNLRQATDSENNRNRVLPRRAGGTAKGITLVKRTGKYQAQIRANNKTIYLGVYDSPDAARAAYVAAAIEHFGELARVE
jgi:hypothetical protein